MFRMDSWTMFLNGFMDHVLNGSVDHVLNGFMDHVSD